MIMIIIDDVGLSHTCMVISNGHIVCIECVFGQFGRIGAQFSSRSLSSLELKWGI
jgi:hypothetical protein